MVEWRIYHIKHAEHWFHPKCLSLLLFLGSFLKLLLAVVSYQALSLRFKVSVKSSAVTFGCLGALNYHLILL